MLSDNCSPKSSWGGGCQSHKHNSSKFPLWQRGLKEARKRGWRTGWWMQRCTSQTSLRTDSTRQRGVRATDISSRQLFEEELYPQRATLPSRDCRHLARHKGPAVSTQWGSLWWIKCQISCPGVKTLLFTWQFPLCSILLPPLFLHRCPSLINFWDPKPHLLSVTQQGKLHVSCFSSTLPCLGTTYELEPFNLSSIYKHTLIYTQRKRFQITHGLWEKSPYVTCKGIFVLIKVT